jgi:DNA-binding protein HU-beta
MNRTQLVNEIAQRLAAQAAALPKAKIAAVLVAMQAEITDSLRRGEAVSIAGWGTWRVEKRAARQVRVPGSTSVVSLKATRVPKWQASTAFRLGIASGKPIDQHSSPGGVRCNDTQQSR